MTSDYQFDPELREEIATLPQLGGTDLGEARQRLDAAMRSLPAAPARGVTVLQQWAPGMNGQPDVPITVYRPNDPVEGTCILDVHGGGFTMGSASMNHAANLRLSERLAVTVASVDYRLAPEHAYPAALSDCYAALRWAQTGGFDRSASDQVSVALHGFSAGAGLCAGLSLWARDEGGPAIAFQYLGCPVLDDRLTSRSMMEFDDTPMWDRGLAAASWKAYLGKNSDTAPAYAAPARATDLTGLPATYIAVMTFDPLRDEGMEYAQRLVEAGVPTELHLFPGTFHGSNLVHRADISRRETRERDDVLRRGLSLPARQGI